MPVECADGRLGFDAILAPVEESEHQIVENLFMKYENVRTPLGVGIKKPTGIGTLLARIATPPSPSAYLRGGSRA